MCIIKSVLKSILLELIKKGRERTITLKKKEERNKRQIKNEMEETKINDYNYWS